VTLFHFSEQNIFLPCTFYFPVQTQKRGCAFSILGGVRIDFGVKRGSVLGQKGVILEGGPFFDQRWGQRREKGGQNEKSGFGRFLVDFRGGQPGRFWVDF